METTFYFVRHGESEANIKQIMDGQRVDAPLTEKGREQAKSLIPYFKEKKHI